MRQQLALAKTLLVPTPLLLLDEPTTHLDPDAQLLASRLLRNDWCRYRPTIILTSHHLSLIEELCDSVGILDRGTLLAVDSPKSLRHNPYHSLVTVRIRNGTADLLQSLTTAKRSISTQYDGDTAHITVAEDELNPVLERLLQNHAQIMEVVPVPSWDETIRQILGGQIDS